MSKYQLEDLLNEITGTGRIGTYLNTYRGLLDKVDQIENKGIRVKKLGMSGDGKVPFEFEIYPGDKDEAFSVYPYKFDPADEDDMQELPFSIGGKPVAIRVAKELLGQGAMSNAEVKDAKDYLKSTGDEIPAGFEENIDEVTMANVNVDEVKMHLDAYEAGNIDGDDLHQAISEIFFGKVKAPGMEESVKENLVDEDDVRYFDIHFGDKYSEDFIVDYIKSGNFEAALDEYPLEDEHKDFWEDELAQFDAERDDVTVETVDKSLKEHFKRFI